MFFIRNSDAYNRNKLFLMKSDLYALGAIVLWASLASLVTLLSDLPPFLLTGIGLLFGSLVSIPLSKLKIDSYKIPTKTLLVGIYGLFGYHLMLFIALQTAPAVEANLVNYLWPLLIVILAPLFSKKLKLTLRHLIAAATGFLGAALAIVTSGNGVSLGFNIGYLFALSAAIIWASYSLLTTKLANFPTSAIGLFAFASGSLALLSHLFLETPVSIAASDWLLLALLGLGPLGGAFYFWDAALKNGDPRRIGLLAFLTPLLSTVALLIVTGEPLSWELALAALLIVGGSIIGSSGSRESASR